MAVMVCGSQVGKTDGVLLNLMGHRLDTDPAPVIYFSPTQNQAKSISKFRVAPMLASVRSLDEALEHGMNNTIFEKHINGQRLGISWMGGKTEQRSYSAPLVLIDERDAMAQLGAEGDIVDVIQARTASYPDPMVVVTSSPLKGRVQSKVLESGLEHWVVDAENEIDSPSWLLWQQGTRHEWAWPCPHCGEFFVPRRRLLWWEQTDDPDRAAESAVMICPHCGSQIGYERASSMNDRGLFVAPGQSVTPAGELVGEERHSAVFSCWVSGLASNWYPWPRRVRDFVRAEIQERKIPGSLQAVINTQFGELYADSVGEVDDQTIRQCMADYALGDVREEVTTLTMGVDVSADRFIYVVRGFSPEFTSWLVDYGYLFGDTDTPAQWRVLEEFMLDSDWQGHTIVRTAVDAGWRPNNTYDYARKHKGSVFATMGTDNQKAMYATRYVDIDIRGKVVRNGAKLSTYNANMAKEWVHSHAMYDAADPGAFFVPRDTDEDYFRQLTSEYRTERNGKVQYRRLREANHYLDCECMAYVMAYTMGVRKRAHKRTARGVEQPMRQQPGAGWGGGWGSNW